MNRKTLGEDHPNIVRAPARPGADRGRQGRPCRRRIAVPPGAGHGPQDVGRARTRSWRRRSTVSRGRWSNRAVRRSGGRAAGGAEHRPPRARQRPSADRDLPDQSRVRAAGAQRSRQRPRRCSGRRCRSGSARPGSCRPAGARSSKTTGASAPRRACSAPRSRRWRATTKPRPCCSRRTAISRPCPAQDRETKATLTRLVALYDAWGRPDKAAAYRALLAS